MIMRYANPRIHSLERSMLQVDVRPSLDRYMKQEAQLSPRDRAMRRAS